MATTADNKGVPGKQPISAHPAFPAIVALWIAVLLGLGTLVVPAALLEQVSLVTGLAKIVPAAEPPLGMTARALAALTGTLFGALLGFAIARRIAGLHSPSPRRAAAGRKPINALDELGDEGLDGGLEHKGGRRRSLALAEEAGESDFLDHAPLPDGPLEVEEETLDALDLDGLDLDDLTVEATEDEDESFGFAAEDDFEAFEDDDDDDLPPQTFVAAADANPDEDVPDMAYTQAVDEDWADRETDPEFTSEMQSGRDVFAASAMSFTAPTLARSPVQDVSEAAEPVAERSEKSEPRPAWADAPLEELGLVQLAQRLADSIERHREFRAAKATLAAGSAAPPQSPVEAHAAEEVEKDGDEAFAAEGADEIETGQNYLDDRDEEFVPFAAFSIAQPAEAEDAVDTEEQFAHDEDAGSTGAEESLFARLGGVPKAEESASEDADSPADEAESVAERQIFQPAATERDEYGHGPSAGFASLEQDEEEDDDYAVAASFSLPLGGGAQARAGEETAAEDLENDEPTDLTGYGSLLGKPNPFRADDGEFVRIEDEPQDADGLVEPVVVFPADADATSTTDPQASARPAALPKTAANPEENERALREALLNLQRMSGAA